MYYKKKKKFKKIKHENICIKCKTMRIAKTGEGRRFNLCTRCYTVNNKNKLNAEKLNENKRIVGDGLIKSNKRNAKCPTVPKLYTIKNQGNENSRYWRSTSYIRLKTKFRYQALQVYGLRCMCCGVRKESRPIELDHIQPISIYPEKEFDFNNTQALCDVCNMGKSNKDFTDYRSDLHKRLINIHIENLKSNDSLFLIYKAQQNKNYQKMTDKEKVRGISA